MSASHGALKHHFEDIEQQRGVERLGMWMFLTTEILFFGGAFLAYTVYRLQYSADFAHASSLLNVLIAGINTVLLITSSLTMTLAIRNAQLGERSKLIRNLLITAILGTAFMCFKAYEYYIDWEEHLIPWSDKFSQAHLPEGANPEKIKLFFCFYYGLTAIHGIHLIIGIGCVLYLVGRVYNGTMTPSYYAHVEVVSLYWHLVDAIWLFLMPLLYLAGPHSLKGLHF
ncbi:MAG: cytochrome c oxidase subunit 3 [Zavarzinella sp.]